VPWPSPSPTAFRDATETAAGHTSAGPAALVALHEFLDHASIDRLRVPVGLTPSGAVRLVDRLSEQGYVQSGPGADGRSVALVLTPAGREAAERVLAARAAALDSLLGALTRSDKARLTQLAERLLAVITEERLRSRGRGDQPSGGWLCRLCDFGACGRDVGRCPAANAAGTVGGSVEGGG
jgi:MarR family transcriptional repressor of emrRAB